MAKKATEGSHSQDSMPAIDLATSCTFISLHLRINVTYVFTLFAIIFHMFIGVRGSPEGDISSLGAMGPGPGGFPALFA